MGIQKGGVAFFDSGIGGLTVVNACRKWLPDVLFYYYGDNRHAPYGNLPSKKIKKYVMRAFKRFKKLKVAVAVVACNTATAICIDELRSKFKFSIVGAEPAVLSAAQKGGEVAILTTRATSESARLHNLCRKAESSYPDVKIEILPCDKLAGEIERHIFEREYDYTRFLPMRSPEVVVLGCTHYVYIAEQIERFYNCCVIDGNEGIARRLFEVLGEGNCQNEHLRPLNNHHRPKSARLRPFLVKFMMKREEKKDEKNRRERRFESRGKKHAIDSKQKGLGGIVFLGKDKKRNKNIYEHLFL